VTLDTTVLGADQVLAEALVVVRRVRAAVDHA
jgi:hypothetical protein